MVGHELCRPTAQPEAHEWISAWLRVRGRGIGLCLAGHRTPRKYFSGSSSPTRRRCMILACQRACYGPGESPATPRHAHSTTLTHPCSLAPTLTRAHSFIPPRTLANTPLPPRTRTTILLTPSTLDPAPSPRAARALQRYAALLAEHPPPPPAWPGQVHGAVYAAAAQAMEEGSRDQPARR